MARVRFEIHCNDCYEKNNVSKPNEGWFIVLVNTEWKGKNYKFVCPKCGREHPRTIDAAGKMVAWTDEDRRFVGSRTPEIDVARGGSDSDKVDRILPSISAWSVKPRLELLNVVPCGFMAEAWIRKAAEEKGIPSEEKD